MKFSRAAGAILLGASIPVTGWLLMDPPQAEAPTVTFQPLLTEAVAHRWLVYPYSIVPGGVHSPEEANEKKEHDPFVADHYRNLTIALPVGRGPLHKYASYRYHNHAYSTRYKLAIPEGEDILSTTDRGTYVRERCGNVLSDTQDYPVLRSAKEEAAILAAMDQPLGTVDLKLEGPLFAASFPDIEMLYLDRERERVRKVKEAQPVIKDSPDKPKPPKANSLPVTQPVIPSPQPPASPTVPPIIVNGDPPVIISVPPIVLPPHHHHAATPEPAAWTCTGIGIILLGFLVAWRKHD